MTLSVSILKRIIVFIAALAVIVIAFVPPISQDPAFHQFADNRNFLSIHNFWNVLTNIGFLWIGLLGLYKLLITKQLVIIPVIKLNYSIFFIGVALVAFGSSYYHWQPNNQTLIWDRLPMTIAFMALLSIAFAEFLDVNLGKIILFPLLAIGLFSVGYWYFGEISHKGDLRLYALVQFLPMVILPLLLAFGKPVFNSKSGYWLLLIAYLLAKLVEYFDVAIFKLTNGLMAGHAIKHVLVFAGLYAFMYKKQVSGKEKG